MGGSTHCDFRGSEALQLFLPKKGGKIIFYGYVGVNFKLDSGSGGRD